MNLQANAFLYSLKKVKWLFIIYSIIIMFYLFNLYENNLISPISEIDMLSIQGIIIKKEMITSIALFFTITQILLIVLLLRYFNLYEINNSPEFLFLRTKKKKVLGQKFLVAMLVVLVIRSAYAYLMYLFFKNYFVVEIKNIIYSVLAYLMLVILIYLYEYIKYRVLKQL